ncbi:MAG: hypothetical protein LBQ12_12335 [Deltaproteobacteria bacterium]|jgi:hypothetical protein|nr:hypothetical protein [Deltaproteobacteria bacterium]
MDPAYKLMLIGLGIAVFFTPLMIIQWKVIRPRARKAEREAAARAALPEPPGSGQ